MIILLVINIIGLFITIANVLLFIETLRNAKEISKTCNNNLDYLDEISHKLNNLVHTVDHNNLKYEGQFNDIWHRIARKDEPLDPDEVNDQVHQYFNMLDNLNFAVSTTPSKLTLEEKEHSAQDATNQTTKTTIDETGLTITSNTDNSVKEEEHE